MKFLKLREMGQLAQNYTDDQTQNPNSNLGGSDSKFFPEAELQNKNAGRVLTEQCEQEQIDLLLLDSTSPFFIGEILFYSNKQFFIEVQLIYNVVLVSGVQQSDSVIYIYILFQVLFHYGLLQEIEQSSLCYTVGPCLSTLYTVVCICESQAPDLFLPPPFPFGNHKFVFYVCESISVL